MKDLRLWTPLLVGAAALFYFSGCSNEESQLPTKKSEDLPQVKFEFAANMMDPCNNSRAITPVYGVPGFRVYAYKLADNGTDYVFSEIVSFPTLNYSGETKKWTGNAALNVGTYKFIPTYGLNTDQNLSLSSFTNTLFENAPVFSHFPANTNGNTLPEVFLPIRSLTGFRSYNVDITGEPNETVSDTISRAMARVDVMFIKATKLGPLNYREETYASGGDVFGNLGLGKMELRFTSLNQRMNLFGVKQDGVLNANIDTQNLGIDGEGVTIGTRNAVSIIGDDDYFRFDSIQGDDIIRGSAHVFGTYLIPNNDGQRTVGLQLYVEPQNKIAKSTSRTINISLGEEELIPLEQNKVTLIKVYVLRDHLFGVDPDTPEPPEPPVPPIDPPPGDKDFDVVIKVVVNNEWDESNRVNQQVE